MSEEGRNDSIAPATEAELRAYRERFPTATPAVLLRHAIREDRPRLVAAILDGMEVDLNAPCEPDVEDSLSPLAEALHADHPRIADLLLRQPALSPVESLPEYDRWGWARTASLETVRRFLEHPATDVNRRDGNGSVLLHAVVVDPRGEEKLRFLLSRDGCEPDVEQVDGTTPLYRAALAGNAAAVDLLLERPVDVNNRNRDNRWSVLHVAAAGDHRQIVDTLLRQLAIEVSVADDLGNTALHVASERGFSGVVSGLLGHSDVEINRKNRRGWTPLHLASFAGHVGVVRQLLARPELQVNLVDQDRQTALHWAVHNRQAGVAKLLARQPGANLHITNRVAGQTALDIADALGPAEVAELLRSEMAAHPEPDELSPADDYRPPRYDLEPIEPRRPFVGEVRRDRVPPEDGEADPTDDDGRES